MAGIYLHVPFCSAKCAYCDFYSVANHSMMSGYAAAVEKEWNARRGELGDKKITTVYFGGGTPSLLSPELIRRFAQLFGAGYVEEFTIEVNPEHVDAASAAAWKEAGVNRVSMGVQSLVDTELKRVGRRHSSADALHAIETLQSAGIENISADLIYGLPNQTLATWQQSLDGLLGTGIRHLSAYCLSYEPGTRLYMQRQRGEVMEASEDMVVAMYEMLCKSAGLACMEHYEISNFAARGFRSRHNSSYWTGEPYLGLGPGAHSLGADGIRRFVSPDVRHYVANPTECLCEDEESETDRINDRIMVALRTSEGLDISDFESSVQKEVLKSARPWIDCGALLHEGSVLRVDECNWLKSDAIIRDLFQE